MSETVESPHDRRLRTFLALRLFGPKTAQWRRFYEESGGIVRRRPDVVLSEDELAAELETFRRELLYVGTWPSLLLGVTTVVVSTVCLALGGWLVALPVAAAGALMIAGVVRAVRGRNQQLWQEFERRMAG
jgi:hypothetical protein